MDIIDVIEKFDGEVDYDLAKTCTDVQKAGDSCPMCLKNRYYSDQPVQYTCSQLRHIYVLRYLPVHIKENLKVLEALNVKGVEKDWDVPVEVLALGGGPGSEIAALQTFVKENGFFGSEVPEIHVTRVDRVEEWSEIYKVVKQVSKGKTPKYKYHRINGDVCSIKKYKGAYDLIFLSYIISELTDEKAAELGNALSQVVKDHCILVFNDRNQEAVVNRIESILGLFSVSKQYVSSAEHHVGINYPKNIKERVGPKLRLSSYRRGVIVEP